MSERVVRVVDVSGHYSPGSGRVEVRGPEDLVKHGIHVSPDAVAATWGVDAAKWYQEARGVKGATNNQDVAPKAPNA